MLFGILGTNRLQKYGICWKKIFKNWGKCWSQGKIRSSCVEFSKLKLFPQKKTQKKCQNTENWKSKIAKVLPKLEKMEINADVPKEKLQFHLVFHLFFETFPCWNPEILFHSEILYSCCSEYTSIGVRRLLFQFIPVDSRRKNIFLPLSRFLIIICIFIFPHIASQPKAAGWVTSSWGRGFHSLKTRKIGVKPLL